MKVVKIKLLFFIFCSAFLLLLLFYFNLEHTESTIIKFKEIFNNVEFLSASFTPKAEELPETNELNPEDDLPSLQVRQEQVLSENIGADFNDGDVLIPHQKTQQEIQEELDDIAEKIDLLAQQVADLIKDSKPNEDYIKPEEEELREDEVDKDEKKDQQNKTEENEKLSENPLKKVSVGGGAKPNYLKILISEIQIAGADGEKQEFVELYNPNDAQVDLTGWYLQKKTKSGADYSTFASNNLFSGKKITAKGYFVIARQDFLADVIDIAVDSSLSEDNSLIFKNPNREVSDKVGWGEASDYELFPIANPKTSQTIGRKLILNEEQDTDNNSADFENQLPTPKSKNIIFIEPPPQAPENFLENILISEIQIEPIIQRFVELYNPNSTDVDLSGWYLQRKDANDDSWNSFISATNFQGKTIPANGFFLISRQIENSDILSDITLSENNFLLLKNPGREISDEMSFGIVDENKSFGRKLLAGSEQDTDDNSVDFELDSPTPKAQNIAYVKPPAPTDTTPPTVNFNSEITQNNLNFTINFVITDSIIDAVLPSGLASYVFQWKEESGDWQEDFKIEIVGCPEIVVCPTYHNYSRDFTGENQKTYYFQVKAKDLSGNESDWLPAEPVFTKIEIPEPVETKPILINEIQIEGETVKDDWVELYNANDFDVDISPWSIQRSPESGNIYKKNFEAGQKITARGYFLVVRNDASQNLLDFADMTCLALQLAENSTVYLVKNQEEIIDGNDADIIDKLGIGEKAFAPEGVYAPVPSAQKSITRTVGTDTNDNSADFIISDTPTPKNEHK